MKDGSGNNKMPLRELTGKTITNIFVLYMPEVGGLDQAECFIELDQKFIIDIPFGGSDEVRIKELNTNAKSLFADLSDYPVYYVNKGGKSIAELAELHKKRQQTLFGRFLKSVFGYERIAKEYRPYKTEFKANPFNNIKDRKIVDLIWYPDDEGKGLLLLDNGYLITETTIANHGTGLAGINIFHSLDELSDRRGAGYRRLT